MNYTQVPGRVCPCGCGGSLPTQAAHPTIELEPMIHNGYELVKRPTPGFVVHYGVLRHLIFRTTREAALQDGEAYLRKTGRWIEAPLPV